MLVQGLLPLHTAVARSTVFPERRLQTLGKERRDTWLSNSAAGLGRGAYCVSDIWMWSLEGALHWETQLKDLLKAVCAFHHALTQSLNQHHLWEISRVKMIVKVIYKGEWNLFFEIGNIFFCGGVGRGGWTARMEKCIDWSFVAAAEMCSWK